MNFTQYIKYHTKQVKKYNYFNISQEEMFQILKDDLIRGGIISTWLEDENGKRIAYFDKNTQLILGDEKLKKETKKEVLKEIKNNIVVCENDIDRVLCYLEEQGYIKFKKEPKTYKVFVKVVTINGESKPLYYVTDFHLTDNIDEAKRFEVDEDKDGYAYELVKE